MVDLSKAKKGDKVKFRCGGEAVICSVKEGAVGYSVVLEGYPTVCLELKRDGNGAFHDVCPFDIISIEPAPFDWSTVKPGMAFYINDGSLVWIVGRAFSIPEKLDNGLCFVVTQDAEMNTSASLVFSFSKLHQMIRAPEHDIEVK